MPRAPGGLTFSIGCADAPRCILADEAEYIGFRYGADRSARGGCHTEIVHTDVRQGSIVTDIMAHGLDCYRIVQSTLCIRNEPDPARATPSSLNGNYGRCAHRYPGGGGEGLISKFSKYQEGSGLMPARGEPQD